MPPPATVRKRRSDRVIPLAEDMRFGEEDTPAVRWHRAPAKLPLQGFKVVVIGAGFDGLCAAIRLKQLGIPFEVLEKNADVGGTWLENEYPGCAVDTPPQPGMPLIGGWRPARGGARKLRWMPPFLALLLQGQSPSR